MKLRTKTLLAAAGAAIGLAVLPGTAQACGGFFCNSVQPVNQAAEQIIFADNGDGTVTAIIQIMYQGPSQSFSWLLPISGVPDTKNIGVASNLAFQRLQQATNPQYTLTTSVEGTCRQDGTGGAANGGVGSPVLSAGSGGTSSQDSGGVTVEETGVVGAFEYAVISLDKSLADPAQAAVTWLTQEGYDVPPSAPALLGPYLEDGSNLLALRLTKGADTGSIRPIMLTYAAKKPMIPIKLTAVAANDDMGVLAWLLSDARAVPQNYYSLELNEALINWFNPAATYGAVVSVAADDAGGQGFVTEFAGSTKTLANVAWTLYDEQRWQSFQNTVYTSFDDIFTQAYYQWQGYDGFWDAVKASVTLPSGLTFDNFKLCPSCYSSQIQFTPTDFIAALDTNVIQPMKVVQTVIDAHPELTRLYTTMSADEMTVDPLFTFNHDLPDVSNVHTAKRVIECKPDVSQFDAPWRIELPQGGQIRGAGSPPSTWPVTTTSVPGMPANYRITQQGDTGTGNVYEDNGAEIQAGLKTYNQTVPATAAGTGGTTGNGTGGTATSGGAKATSGDDGSSACAVNPRHAGTASPWLVLGLLALGRRRRR